MIIGLGYQAGTGKDTVGRQLVDEYGYTRRAFGDEVRDLALQVNPLVAGVRLRSLVEMNGWEHAKRCNLLVRDVLVRLGVGCRNFFGPDVWLDRVLPGQPDPPLGDVVVTDVRFPNEVERVVQLGGRVVLVTRPGSRPEGETDEMLNGFDGWHYTICNDGTFAQLEEAVRVMVGVVGGGTRDHPR